MTPEERKARAQQRKTENLIQFAESIGNPLSEAPPNETPREREVRRFSDLLERFRLCERAGCRPPNRRWTWQQIKDLLTAELQTAQRELRWERGDY